MRARLKTLALASAACVLLVRPAWAQDVAALPRLVIEDEVGTASPALEAASQAGAARKLSFAARLEVSLAALDAIPGALDRHLEALRAQRIAVWASLAAPADARTTDAWRQALRAFLTRYSGQLAVLELRVGDQPAEIQRFALQVAATEARAVQSNLVIAINGIGSAELPADLLAYVDLLVSARSNEPAGARQGPSVPHANLRDASAADPEATSAIVRHTLEELGSASVATVWRAPGNLFAAALRALAPAGDLLAGDVTALDSESAQLRSLAAGEDVPTASGQPRLLFDPESSTTYLVYHQPASEQPLNVSIHLGFEGTPMVYDLLKGTVAAADRYTWSAESAEAAFALPSTGRPMLVNLSENNLALPTAHTGVTAGRSLRVDEIVARHQRQQVVQDTLLESYMADLRMQQHFRPTVADPGYDVVTENRFFADREGVEWEERSFAVNGAKWGTDRPPFPLLQAEKVLSLPLELRFDQDYRYTLAGVESIDGTPCYIVRFEPARDDRALYRGTVWIDQDTFARRQVQAVQTSLTAPVISSEETQSYTPMTIEGGRTVHLLTRVIARQILLMAGRNLLLEKISTFSNFELNAPGFADARAAARDGERVMLRDTARGVRYLVKEGEQRVLSERATGGVKAAAFGLLVDPSLAIPVLPIAGLNYLDFEFGGRPDTQFALLFGGVLAAGNLQRPRLGGSPLDASLDFFAIAAPASDRVFSNDAERETERVLTWPMTGGVNLGWQYTPFQKLQWQYHLRFDGYVRDRTTAEDYVVPASTLTNGVGLGWEWKRAGFSAVVNGSVFARANWRGWGPAAALEMPRQTYAKYSAHLTRDFILGPFQKVHLNGAWFGGQRLDRFSRYQFGMFDDTRIHGVPASGLRFDELAMTRGSYSFNIFEQYRLDLFLEQAWGRDRTVRDQWSPLTGTGVAVNVRAPWSSMLRVDFGKSVLPARYRGVGSTVLQVMLLKPLG